MMLVLRDEPPALDDFDPALESGEARLGSTGEARERSLIGRKADVGESNGKRVGLIGGGRYIGLNRSDSLLDRVRSRRLVEGSVEVEASGK